MKTWLLVLMLVLVPLCTADFTIKCYGEDFLLVRNQRLTCTSKVPQGCYIRGSGEKGCITLNFCDRKGWKCCHSDFCNV